MANATSRVENGFGIRVSETSGEKGVSIIDAFMIEGDNVLGSDLRGPFIITQMRR